MTKHGHSVSFVELCPLSLAAKLNFNKSKVVYCDLSTYTKTELYFKFSEGLLGNFYFPYHLPPFRKFGMQSEEKELQN